MLRRSSSLACFVLLFAASPSFVRAADAPPRWYSGVAIGGGAGVARVDGARLEFGRDRFAFAIAARGGRVLSPRWRVGVQLDAAGASSGRVVPLGPGYPTAPMTTAHRVAVNHFSVVATCAPSGGAFFVRGGAGLAESFTEDWDAATVPVHRRFGPGAVAGFGFAPRLASGARWTVAVDGMVGRCDGHASGAVMLTVGIESR